MGINSKAYGENTIKKIQVAASLRSALEEANRAGFSGGVLTSISQAIQCAEFKIQSDSNLMSDGDRID